MRVYAHDLEKSQAHIFKHAVKSFWKLTISPQKQLNCYPSPAVEKGSGDMKSCRSHDLRAG
jgi:hypothetical protein